jgi:hypothetical protein
MYTLNNKAIGEIPGVNQVPGMGDAASGPGGLGAVEGDCSAINNAFDAAQAIDSGKCTLSDLNPAMAEYLVQVYPQYAPKAPTAPTKEAPTTFMRVREEVTEYEAISSPAQAAKYVSMLQDQLTKLGFNPGKIDGKYGSNTKSALKSAVPTQYKTKYASTGALQSIGFGPRTAAAIRDSIQYQFQYGFGPTAPKPTPTPAVEPAYPPLAPAAAAAMPMKKSYWWVWLLLGLAGVGAAGAIAYYVAKKKSEGEVPYPEGPEELPETTAPAEPIAEEGFEPASEAEEEF